MRRTLQDLLGVSVIPSAFGISTLTVYGVYNAHSDFFVVIKGGDIAIGLRVLEKVVRRIRVCLPSLDADLDG